MSRTTLKETIESLVAHAIDALKADGVLAADTNADVQISRTKDADHGDFACNIALRLAKMAGRSPRDIAQGIIDRLPASKIIEKVEVAGPGFINFYLDQATSLSIIDSVLSQGELFGRSALGAGKTVQVEFVSANPTGPLHVGHGRGAAYGAAVADLLETIGFSVHREYYVNDDGRQMNILAASVWLRYLERCGLRFDFPSNGYKGDYVNDIAQILFDEHADSWACTLEALRDNLPPDEAEGGDKETHIDALIERARALLGETRYRFIFDLGLNNILDDIRDDLHGFGIDYEQWYSEKSLAQKGAVNRAIERLRDQGHVYEKDGALWFRSTEFGDEKDRVVQRDNGQTTYFASDIAYHMDKLERGFDRIIDVWGADHHGYVPRVKAALQALGCDAGKLDVLLVQFAILYRGGQKVQMSTRSGSFVTLRQLREEVGKDAARFFYVIRKCEQHLDFDLDLAKSREKDNPVYYIQYAHARICSVLRKLAEQGWTHDMKNGQQHQTLLVESHECALLDRLARYPEVIESAALAEEPHQLAHFLRELAEDFHTYYNAHKVLVEEQGLRDARINLSLATRQVIKNGLELLGVSAPEEM